MISLYILLAIIAYILWRIYRQKEEEKNAIYNEKLDSEYEQERKERFKDYPHLYGKIGGNYLDVFAHHAENNISLLNLAFMLYLQESTKIDFSEGAQNWDSLWDLTEEMLEDLERHHEGTSTEHLIAVCVYWQIATEAMGELINKSQGKTKADINHDISVVEARMLDVEPYTDIEKILSLFPQKTNHPMKEMLFRDEKGNFPRESKGSIFIHKRISI